MISPRERCRIILGEIHESFSSCMEFIICSMHHPHLRKKLHIVLKLYHSILLLDSPNYIDHGAVDSEDDRNSAEVKRFGLENTKPMSTLMFPEDLLRVFNVFDKDFDGLIVN